MAKIRLDGHCKDFGFTMKEMKSYWSILGKEVTRADFFFFFLKKLLWLLC